MAGLLKRNKSTAPKIEAVKDQQVDADRKNARQGRGGSSRQAMIQQSMAMSKFTEEEQWVHPEEHLVIKRIPLGEIRLDPDNARTRYLDLRQPTLNPFASDHHLYAEYELLIQGLITFAEHLKEQPLRQMFTVYPEDGKFYVAYGSRRFLALLIAFGPDYAPSVRCYPSKPADLSLSRFQENSQRENLPVHASISDFKLAYADLCKSKEAESLTDEAVGKSLGVAKSNANVLRRAAMNPDIMEFVESGLVVHKEQLKKLVQLKTKEQMLKYLSSNVVEEEKAVVPEPAIGTKRLTGRPKTSVTFPKKLVSDITLLQRLIRGEFSGQFTEADFQDFSVLQEKLKALVGER